MTRWEQIQFYDLDSKKYDLSSNREFQTFFANLEKWGSSIVGMEQLQEIIDKINYWYEIKYPDQMLEDEKQEIPCYSNFTDFSDLMDQEQFYYRLSFNSRRFLEEEYHCKKLIVIIRFEEENHFELLDIKNGCVDLTKVDEEVFRINKKDLPDFMPIDEFYSMILHTIEAGGDLSSLEKAIRNHQMEQKLKEYVLNLASLKILFSTHSIPDITSKRANKMLEEFQEYYPKLQLGKEIIEQYYKEGNINQQ